MKKRTELRIHEGTKIEQTCNICKHRLSNPFKHNRRCEKCFLGQSKWEFNTDKYVIVEIPMEEMKIETVSNLITDMIIKGASQDEIARAVKHSMVVIDAYKRVKAQPNIGYAEEVL